MKELIILVMTTPWGKIAKIHTQTHRSVGFGDSGLRFRCNGFCMISQSYPAGYEEGLYVRGEDSEKDNDIIQVPNEDWLKRLRDAVRAYNKHFKGGRKKIELNEKFIEVIK